MSGLDDRSATALQAWLPAQRWFAGKARRIETVTVEDRVPLGGAVLHLIAVALDDGTTQRYAVPLGGDGIQDALDGSEYVEALLDLIAREGRAAGAGGILVGQPTRAFPRDLGTPVAIRRLGAEQSNTSIALGGRLVLKHLRRLAAGPNPEEEVGRFLTERTSFTHAPRLVGHAEYHPATGEPSTVAVIHELVADARDGWAWMLSELEALYARLGPAGAHRPDDRTLREAGATTLESVRRLGTVVAELHRALASDPGDPAFAPDRATEDDLASWAHGITRQLDEARAVAGDRMPARAPDVTSALRGLAGLDKIRHHGDFHLGQTLYRPRDGAWAILDFEGEPLRPLAERRRKACPLRDVAGLLRSLDYAATSAQPPGLEAAAAAWAEAAGAVFLDAYRRGTDGATFVPAADVRFSRAVAVFVLEKAAYEIVYEANHRPDWLPIPLRGLTRALAALDS